MTPFLMALRVGQNVSSKRPYMGLRASLQPEGGASQVCALRVSQRTPAAMTATSIASIRGRESGPPFCR